MESCNGMMEFNQLLLTKRKAIVTNHPFFYGYIDDFLPNQLYSQLLETFPSQKISINYSDRSRYNDRNLGLMDFFSKNPSWKILWEFFASENFLGDLQKFCLGPITTARGGPQKNWHYVHDFSMLEEMADRTPIKVTFKLSHLGNGDWIHPHTDLPEKIVTLLLYFAEPDWRESYGGGTEIYVPKYSPLVRNWHNIDAPFEWMNPCQTINFVPNRLAFLVKSKNSWHGVSPLTCSEGRTRKSLMISIQHRDPVENPLQARFCQFLKRQSLRVIQNRMRLKAESKM